KQPRMSIKIDGKEQNFQSRFLRVYTKRNGAWQMVAGDPESPGERLEVDELAKKLDVSFTPVRHALQTLNGVGLVEIRPRSGTFVARFSWKDIADNFDVRRSLECLAAETAVRGLPQAAIDRLSQISDF